MSGIRVLAVAAAALLIVGCSRSAPEPVPGENGAAIAIEDEATVKVPDAAAAPENAADNTAENASNVADNAVEPPAEAPTPIDEQMQDDAAATGMTARASRESEEAANAAE